MASRDDDGLWLHLPLDASAAELGDALSRCLAASRFIEPGDPEFDRVFTGWEPSDDDRFEAPFFELAPVKIRSSLYKGSLGCYAVSKDGVITINAQLRDGPASWAYLPERVPVTVSADASAEEIGAALLEGFAQAR